MYTVYKINNILTNNYYIGVHKTNNPNDSYMGSGILIQKQIKEYGLKNFNKEILFIFDNEKDAFNKEYELVNENLSNPLCLNIAEGGHGGAIFTGRHHTDETKMKNRLAALGRKYIHNENESKLVHPEELEYYLDNGWKIGRHKKDCGFGRKAWNKNLKIGSQSDEHRRKISESLKRYNKNK